MKRVQTGANARMIKRGESLVPSCCPGLLMFVCLNRQATIPSFPFNQSSFIFRYPLPYFIPSTSKHHKTPYPFIPHSFPPSFPSLLFFLSTTFSNALNPSSLSTFLLHVTPSSLDSSILLSTMFMKALASLALLAAPLVVSAYEPVTCQKNATQNIITSITSANDFCTMLPGYGVYPVAPNEGCASVYCYGAASKLGPPMPKGYILSANYAVSPNNSYVQVTGCIDSSVWGQNPTDEGGQMDSHGWPYSCQGWKKFVSLIEPASNTYCIRCCSEDNNVDCNTSKLLSLCSFRRNFSS